MNSRLLLRGAMVLGAGGSLIVAAGTAKAEAPAEIHHIHGLAVDRQHPEILYVATHTGLVRLRPGALPEWVGEHRFDLMGFTAHPSEVRLVYASGHPDVHTYAREGTGNLGLLVSRDGGSTWQSVALKGRADLHALTFSPRDGGQLYGWNVTGQHGLYRISVTTWELERLSARGLSNVFSLASSPESEGPLFAGTEAGLSVSRDGGRTWSLVNSVPAGPVTAVAYHLSQPGQIYAYGHRAGVGLMRSSDDGKTWEATGLHTGADTPVIAVTVGPGPVVAVATIDADVTRSSDGGQTWARLVVRGRSAAQRR